MAENMQDLLGIADLRGDYQILHTKTFLVTDGEIIKWRFIALEKLVKLRVEFSPTKTLPAHPPINVYGDKNTSETVVLFKGWNAQTTYRIDSPVDLIRIGSSQLSFSVLNMHLGNSNVCTMQIYRKLLRKSILSTKSRRKNG